MAVNVWCLIFCTRTYTHTHTHTHTHTYNQILDHNPLGLRGVTPIIKHSQVTSSRLTSLSLRNTCFDPECARQTALALNKNTHLLSLALDDNREFSDEGVAAFADGLVSEQLALQSLSMRNIGAKKFDAIKTALRLNVSLDQVVCDDVSVANFLESSWFVERAVLRICHRIKNNKMNFGTCLLLWALLFVLTILVQTTQTMDYTVLGLSILVHLLVLHLMRQMFYK